MAFTTTISATKTIPHAVVYELTLNDVTTGYKIEADEGYILYDSDSIARVENPETGEAETTVNSAESIFAPVNFNFDAWKTCKAEELPTRIETDLDWEDIQHGGERTDYSYAFANWSASKIEPKYPLNNVNRIQYAFMECGNITELSNLEINITAENPSLMYTFANCYLLKKPPVFTFAAAVVRTYTAMYAGCVNLTQAEIYLGDGSQNPISIRNTMQNTFLRCAALTELRFTGKGAPFGLDLSYSAGLSYDSLISLKSALMDVSGATSGNYDIILHPDSYALLSDDDVAEIAALGWNLVQKSNTTENS